ncbi:aldehyde dehydrogenase family protein [Nocardia sp. CA-119907]|uniref:aldehyde dehydrogenase family protein n=1 Tax=Nocardia sp. CA-119907 TaxID=3239973 RepID=UPI003D9654B7
MTATEQDVRSTHGVDNSRADSEIEVRNPADGRVVNRVPVRSALSVAAAAAQLREQQVHWEALGPRKRAEWLFRLQDWLIDNSSRITDVLQSETGKSRYDAAVEVPTTVDLIRYWGTRAAGFLADERPTLFSGLGVTKHLVTTYRPYPVVGVITPWNFPLAMISLDAIPALMAGAAVLVKPSETTPLSALELARGWSEIGAPAVLSVMTGLGDTGRAVVENVDYVQFTGSTPTGRAIAQACAQNLTPYSLEMGGKDPAIVLADADIEHAARGIAFGGMFNSGQVCVSVERVYVEAPIHDRFVAALTEQVRSLRQGHDGAKFAYDLGAMATATQRDIVQRHVDDAIAHGATPTVGGKAGPATFFEPTVLVGVDQSMVCVREETFGPTLPVIKVADEEEAVRLANDSAYGLSASVWTSDRRRGVRIARQLQSGAVNINDVMTNAFMPAVPMGGWKDSGVGARSGGAAGIRKYCRPQTITVPRGPARKRELQWYPASQWRHRAVFGLGQALAARGARRLALLLRRS